MNRRLDPIEQDIGLPDKARGLPDKARGLPDKARGLPDNVRADPAGRWDQKARTLGYANVAPLVADLCVAYDDGRIARAKGRPCRQIVFKGDHAQAWVEGWLGWKKPAA